MSKQRNLSDYLTISEAARVLGVTSQTLRNWDSDGKLIALRHPLNSYRLYKKQDLIKVLDKLEK